MTDDPMARLKAGLDADEAAAELARERAAHSFAPIAYVIAVGTDPDRMFREVAAKREILDFTLCRPHFWNPGDEYYSCSQAEDDAGGGPGSGCSDPDRQGDPCDCGRDASVEHVVRTLAAVYGDDDTREVRP